MWSNNLIISLKQLVQIPACYLLGAEGDGFWASVEIQVCSPAVLLGNLGKHLQPCDGHRDGRSGNRIT